MSVILGVGGAFKHDPSAAILIDGRLVAAADEERFIRVKKAVRKEPVHAIRFCLDSAGIEPKDVDHIAFPWSPRSYSERRWSYLRRLGRTDLARTFKSLIRPGRDAEKRRLFLHSTLKNAGFKPGDIEIHWVDHHLAHASSSYHLSGFPDAAVMTVDGSGEFTSTMFAEGAGGEIRKIHEILTPDSLGLFYSTITELCGFRVNFGEYKLMGMSAFGDPGKIDIRDVISWDDRGFCCHDDYRWAHGRNRYRKSGVVPKKLVELWGPPRSGDELGEPYIHIAAAAQHALEEITLGLLSTYLSGVLKKHQGRLCFAGGCALNVRLNQKLIQHPDVKELWVQPAANDSGSPLGAATWLAHKLGEKIEPMTHPYYGPSYSADRIREVLDRFRIPYSQLDDPVEKAVELLADGKVVAWFQGAMEFGPRALGNRSILGHPALDGMSDQINQRIKFREKWRPFCPSILDSHAEEILGTAHDSPYMTFAFEVTEAWKKKVSQVVHVDGTARPQIVTRELNPLYYELLSRFHRVTGLPCLINTSLNRRGEPMVCSPGDALEMFYGSGLEQMILGDFLVQKS